VLTSDVVGTDFGLPLVRPVRGRAVSTVRVVRSRCRAHGGVVVWFTDGTKTPPLHGRTSWILAEPDVGGRSSTRHGTTGDAADGARTGGGHSSRGGKAGVRTGHDLSPRCSWSTAAWSSSTVT
jgi:hypothetical protein